MIHIKTYISLGFLCLFATFGLSLDKAYAQDWDHEFYGALFQNSEQEMDTSFLETSGTDASTWQVQYDQTKTGLMMLYTEDLLGLYYAIYDKSFSLVATRFTPWEELPHTSNLKFTVFQYKDEIFVLVYYTAASE
ncbi:MAG: hypothetical protein U9Q15_05555 [Patescibacteria group bacterium]|nr:hypothetical protein [Patescibacteria group bacterium]